MEQRCQPPLEQSVDPLIQPQWTNRSLQDISEKEMPTISVDEGFLKTCLDYRNSMPNIQEESRSGALTNQYYKQPIPVPVNKTTYSKDSSTTNK